MQRRYDFLIIGSGIIGLALAYKLRQRNGSCTIAVIDKETDTAMHASGRNSGVLHAGFYYTADSLKARFTVAGSTAMKAYCKSKGLLVNECGKLVVATNEAELSQLYELERRGLANGSTIQIISAEEAQRIEPRVKTFKKALYSPFTASIDPIQVCQSLKQDLTNLGVEFHFGTAYIGQHQNIIRTSQGDFQATKVVNCAGLYADKIAKDFGFGSKYTIIPFKGLYLKYSKNQTDLKTNIYPVPNLKNPFLGVHFTKTVHGDIKIGPTAMPAFWRENYTFSSGFKLAEALSILRHEAELFLLNSFNFRELAVEELRKLQKKYLIRSALKLVNEMDAAGFGDFTRPGIRAQLLNKSTRQLVQDFVVEGDSNSVHVLNAVSPGFTCSLPFAEYVLDTYIKR